MGFYSNDGEYRHKYHNMQHINVKRNPCFIVHTTASPKEPPSVTSGLRVSAQPAKPALLIRLLYEQLPKVHALCAHGMFTTFCVLFPNSISHFKILAMP